VTACGFDRKAKRPIKVTKTIDDIKDINEDLKGPAKAAKRNEVVAEPPARTVQEAEQRAIDVLFEQQSKMVEATGATVGLPDLRSGRLAVITGAGRPLFDGEYRILSSTHTINDNGYRTTFTARRLRPIQEQKPAGGTS
jgi:phage protein D